jgi:ABC-type dipeptide/oligopeptide/nickel transport system permease component
MATYVLRKLLYNVPVYLGIVLFLMACLRVNDPVSGYLGKNASQEDYIAQKESMGHERPVVVQYGALHGKHLTLDIIEQSGSQEGRTVGAVLNSAIVTSQ